MGELNILQSVDNVKTDPTWNCFLPSLSHPDQGHNTFLRYNRTPINLIDMYKDQTCFFIGRGNSLSKYIEDEKIKNKLLHKCIFKYCVNTSPDVLGFDCNLWSCCDRVSKFSKNILLSPTITKIIPMNRLIEITSETAIKDTKKTLAYKDPSNIKYASQCPNMVGSDTFLMADLAVKNVPFYQAFLESPYILYGKYPGSKSVFLFALKTMLLLGFKRIVLLGVDFDMDINRPYYNETLKKYNKYHVDHNNKLYNNIIPDIEKIYKNINKKYDNVEILTGNPIKTMPFIKNVDINNILDEEIKHLT